MSQNFKPLRPLPNRPDFFAKITVKDPSLMKQDPQIKFKTELCRNLESGFCEYGDKCSFAHSIEELRDKNSLGTIKSLKCKNFFEFGYCISGIKCQFSHREISPETCNSPYASTKASRKGSDEGHRGSPFVDLEFRNPY